MIKEEFSALTLLVKQFILLVKRSLENLLAFLHLSAFGRSSYWFVNQMRCIKEPLYWPQLIRRGWLIVQKM